MVKNMSIDAIAHRLKITREAMEMTKSEFADKAGIARNTYSQWEGAKGRPSLDQAIALCLRHGLTLDWIYFGNGEGLPLRLARGVGLVA